MSSFVRPRVHANMNDSKNGSNGAGGDAQSDWMTAQQTAELEEKMVRLGKDKYGLDDVTAREWAHAFVTDDDELRAKGD